MILFGNLLIAIGQLLSSICFIFLILFIARAVLSWVSPDPRNPIVMFIASTTEPVLGRIRSVVPPIGMLDFSVLIAIIGLELVRTVVGDTLVMYGSQMLAGATSGATRVGF